MFRENMDKMFTTLSQRNYNVVKRLQSSETFRSVFGLVFIVFFVYDAIVCT